MKRLFTQLAPRRSSLLAHHRGEPVQPWSTRRAARTAAPKIARSTPAASSASSAGFLGGAKKIDTGADFGIAARLLQPLAQLGDALDGVALRTHDRHPAVAELHDAIERRRAVAADDDRAGAASGSAWDRPRSCRSSRTRRGTRPRASSRSPSWPARARAGAASGSSTPFRGSPFPLCSSRRRCRRARGRPTTGRVSRPPSPS